MWVTKGHDFMIFGLASRVVSNFRTDTNFQISPRHFVIFCSDLVEQLKKRFFEPFGSPLFGLSLA